jgi:hypothetical protein
MHEMSLLIASLMIGSTLRIFVLCLETGSTPRPHNTQLYLRETEELGIEGGLGTSGFEEWWVEYLRGN